MYTDPEDHALMVNEMIQQRNDLKREQHMKEIEKLELRQYGLRIMTVQRKVIRILEKQVREIKVDVENMYSPMNAAKDTEIKGYLIYLLDMQDRYKKQVDKLKVKVKEKNKQMRDAFGKLNAKKREYAKIIRSKVRSVKPEKTIEMYESRLEKEMHQLGIMTTQNRKSRDQIENMFFEREKLFCALHALTRKNIECRNLITRLLDDAVQAYRSREDFSNKSEVMQERFKADLEKIEVNKKLLHRIKERDMKAEEFEQVKAQQRVDCRTAEIEGMVERGITGLEAELDAAQETHSRVLLASGATGFVDLLQQFEQEENKNFNHFRYVGSLAEELDHLATQVKELRKTIEKAKEGLTDEQRRSRKHMVDEQAKINETLGDVQMAIAKRDNAREEMNRALDHLKFLHETVLDIDEDEAENETESYEKEIAKEKLFEWLSAVEFKIADNLKLVEFAHYIKAGSEDEKEKLPRPSTGIDSNFDEQDLESIRSTHEDEMVKKPRPLTADPAKRKALKEMAEAERFMQLTELQSTARSVVEETTSSDTESPLSATSSSPPTTASR